MPTIEAMKETKSFVSVGAAEKMLGHTEPVDSVQITDESTVSFKVPVDWNDGVKGKNDLSKVGVLATIDGKEFELSKSAALRVGAVFGIQSTYSQKIPGDLYEGLLNYHFQNLGGKSFSGLAINDTLHGLVRPGLSVYSNIDLLANVIEGVEAVYGKDTQVLIDRRTFNTLEQTDIRLVIPEVERVIEDGGLLDVPTGAQDDWSAGIHIANSVTGKTPTMIQTYLFRYWCANGATVQNSDVGMWHRAYDSAIDVYGWAKTNTEEILADMEKQFDAVQSLTATDVDGRVGQVLNETLRPLRIGATIRNEVAEGLLEYNDVSLYTVMNAVTSHANQPDMNQDYINRFMVAGGNLASRSVTSEKANVWREGHLAPAESTNPYEI